MVCSFLALITIIPILGIISNISTDEGIISESNDINEPDLNIEATGFWTNASLIIDNAVSDNTDIGIYNWTEINETLICNGSGTMERPFIIENVTIDADGIGSGLIIRNSDGIYFNITNCTVINTGPLPTDYGIKVENSEGGIFSNNNLSLTEHSAYDDGMNIWIHNEYGDYEGYDINGDNIGDTPHPITGGFSADPEPITDRKDDLPPIISFLSPEEFDAFSTTAPDFEVSIDEYILNETWYRIKNTTETYISGNFSFIYPSGTVSQSIWDLFGNNDEIVLEVFANDSVGNEASEEISLWKDIGAPILTIMKPLNNSDYAWLSPKFNITITDVRLDESWYTIDNDPTKYQIDITTSGDYGGDINQLAWDEIANGSIVVIRFYANDTGGNTVMIKVILTKTIPPDDDEEPPTWIELIIEFFEQIWAFLISFFVGLLGIALVYKYSVKKNSPCACRGQPDCSCDL